MVLECTVKRSARLLSVLRAELGLSSSLVKRLKWQNALFVNGSPAHTDAQLVPGDRVRVELLERTEGFAPEPMDLSIVYEDESLIALDKPGGVLMHPSPQKNEGTLANGLLQYYEDTGQACGIHPVTRLDRDTFGVVLLAKNAYVHERLRQMLAGRAIQKTYQAAVFGAPTASQGVIDLPVYKLGGGSLLRAVDPRGKPAVTQYRLLKAWAHTSLLELHPLTGRTHQLRLHCMASGFPILGDPQYTSPQAGAYAAAAGLVSQQLCAVQLVLRHPVSGAELVLQSRQRPVCPER